MMNDMKLEEQRTTHKKLLTIIAASNRPHNMRGFLDNLRETVIDFSSIEVLVKIDEGDSVMQSLMEDALNTYPFLIRYIQTPRLDGYYTLHLGYQQLFEMSDKATYFIFPVNEEVRFKTKGWDRVLSNYIKLFPDDLFRLKISRLKYRNYYSHHDCGPVPENYPFLTRKWMELSGGIGDCWGPDGWHQYIDYHLGQTEGIDDIPGLFRSVPIQDILIGGEEAGKELTKEQIKKRSLRICQEWWRMYSTSVQQEFRRLAVQMFAYVWAKHRGLEDFEIIENKKVKKFSIKDNETGKVHKKVFYYHLSAYYIRLENFYFLVKKARYNSVGFLKAYIYPSYGPKSGVMKWLNRMVRVNLVILAVFFSFFVSRNDSIPKLWRYRFYERFKSIASVFYKKFIEKK